jgi:hypothetical protein
MRHNMSDGSCREVFELRIPSYQSGSPDERRKILCEVVSLTGYSVKHSIKLLNHGFPLASGERLGRTVTYDDEVKSALVMLWQASNFLCSKRLVPFIGDLIGNLERHGHLCINGKVRDLLMSLSVSTADRLLADARRRRPRGLGTTQSGNRLCKQIPIRTHNGAVRTVPGYCEADLVAHCGHSVRGSFLYTLVLTDLYNGWTDFEPILERTALAVVAAIEVIRMRLPTPLLGLDTDNGSEFINDDVYEYCRERQIVFERGRPGKKNDQAHVEQKNGSVVRRSVGYERYEGIAALKALQGAYSILRVHLNYFQPSMKLEEKRRNGDSSYRKHDVAQTPLRRLWNCGILTAAARERLEKDFMEADPLILMQQLAWATKCLQPLACTMAPLDIKPKTPSILSPKRKNSSSAVFSAIWADVEQAFAHSKKPCVQRLFARLQARYPERIKDQQIHAFRKRVHEWLREQDATRAARAGGQDAPAKSEALPRTKAAR